MTATIDLRLFATLGAQTPGNARNYPITNGMTIAQLIKELNISTTQARLVFVNGTLADPTRTLNDGDRVGIFPPVGGG